MQQLLRVGNSLHQAFTKAAAGASPATARFLFPAVHRVQHGMSLAESLGWAAERVEITELRMFAAAVSIDGRHGGSSEERRVRKECGSKCRSRWSAYHYTKNNNKLREQETY